MSPDEAAAAAYVASHFRSYGLQTAPHLNGFIQRANVRPTRLAGSTLKIGNVTLEHGDFYVLVSNGTSVIDARTQRLRGAARNKKICSKAVLLAWDLANLDPRQIRAKHVKAILIGSNQKFDFQSYLNPAFSMLSGLPVEGEANIVVLTSRAIQTLNAMPDGAPVSLTIESYQFTLNAVGFLHGTDPDAGAVIISAHLDHLGVGKPDDKNDRIYNGADDDASGVVAVMELAHAFRAFPKPRRSLLFVCYGAEELHGLGVK